MIYTFLCPQCDTVHDDVYRSVENRDDPEICEKCRHEMLRQLYYRPSLVHSHSRDTLRTDFGDGSGEQAYTRRQYLDKCKALGRDPVGMTFKPLKPVPHTVRSH